MSAVVLVIAAAGCRGGNTDNGCQIRRQLVLPDTTPLALLTDVRIDRAGSGFVIFGSDGTSVRWTTIDAAGAFGPEQSYSLPPGTVQAYYALAGVAAPGDRVIIGVLTPSANGSDADLRLAAAPIDGSPASPLGNAVTSFGGGANPQTPPQLAMGTSATAMNAGVAWIDLQSGFPTYAFVDGQGEIVGGQPAVIESEPASGYSCLGFSPGKLEVTISYQRAPIDARLGPSWLIADVAADGAVATLRLNVAQPGGVMSCARSVLYDPMNGMLPEYAMVWQDPSGSWLSVYYGPQTNMVKSFPFASATDFGGADLQPPLMGLAAFGNDFGVLFARSSSVEVWRIDHVGNRRSGVLTLPSVQGDTVGVSSVSSAGLLTSTYADLTGLGTGRRLVVDAVCY